MKIVIDLDGYDFYDDLWNYSLVKLKTEGNTFEELLDNCILYTADGTGFDDEEILLKELPNNLWYNELESILMYEYEMIKRSRHLRLAVNNG